MIEEIFDIVMQSTGTFRSENTEWSSSRQPTHDFELWSDLWVGALPYQLQSELVFDACEPAGYNFRATRQYGCRYSLCRKVQADHENYYGWDTDSLLRRILFLSRLVRPTTISTNLSAKLYFSDGKLQTIVPGPTQVFGAPAFVVADSKWRDWLSASELSLLREHIPNYSLNPPGRVRQARRHLDHAFHSYYLDQRCASLVTSFESLLKISNYRATYQFASRAPKLARRVCLELTEDESRELYNNRSAFVHGTHVNFTGLDERIIRKYNRFEQVLRHTLLQASTDPTFASIFDSNSSIEAFFDN